MKNEEVPPFRFNLQDACLPYLLPIQEFAFFSWKNLILFELREIFLFSEVRIILKMRRPTSIAWFARVASVVSVGTILLFMIGEGFKPLKITFTEWIGLLFFPFGISLGMILAWWKERLGGIVTIGSFLMFYTVNYLISGRFPSGWAFLLFALPGILFLASSYQKRK